MSLRDIDFSPEWTFRTSRSGGSGGQHVNKVESRVELRFSIPSSVLLSDAQKQVLILRLTSRLTQAGELILTSGAERSQFANKKRLIARFYELLEESLQPEKERKPTRVPNAAKRQRLKDKKSQSQKKDNRRKRDWED